MASPDVEINTGCIHTLLTLPHKLWTKIVNATKMVKEFAQEDPRRVIHSFKVGLALVLISILHHFRPSFYGFGENIVWAVLTVILVLEFTVGAALGKGLNRILATWVAGALGVGCNKLTTFCGGTGKDVLASSFVFVIATIVTFMRFSPKLKAKYDYGLMIFILTFCLVSLSEVSGNSLIRIAHERLLTIIIGCGVAIMVCICIFPVWVGQDLHNQIATNIEKLADFLEGFGGEYFNNSENVEASDNKPFLYKYKSVLTSKSSEESMVVLARWEPPHGQFRFRHPWKQYLKIGNVARMLAYKIEALSVYLLNSKQIPYEVRSKIQEACTKISSESGKALKESSLMIKKMAKSSKPHMHVRNAKNAAESLKSLLRTNPWEGGDQLEIIPAATVALLLIDLVISVEKICEAVDELASLAKFVPCEILQRGTVQPVSDSDDSVHVINIHE